MPTQSDSLLQLAELAEAFATPEAAGSRVHGPQHWRAVAHFGLDIAVHTPGADPVVVFCFAALHDTQRRNDYSDPEHGYRAARIASRLSTSLLDFLTDAQLELLMEALDWHDSGDVSWDPTVGACWDADRVTLPRVGKTPAEEYMSTTYAVDYLMDMTAAEAMRAPATWGELVQATLAATARALDCAIA